MRRILIIKSSSMGDVVHALPVAYDIKQALPDSRIDWVVEEAFADIVELSPWIDGKIVTAFRRWRKHPLSAETRAEVARVKKALRENRYDLVIDLQGLVRSALVARWCGVKSVGYSRDTIREPLASFFYTETKRVPESLTPVKRYRTMASVCLEYDIDADHPIYGLKAKPLATRPAEGDYAVMAVNTSREEKLWARDRWIQTTQALVKAGITPVFVWGSAAEEERVRTLADLVPGTVVAPHMTLPEIASVLKASVGLIGVDTGISHLAAALAVPAVGIIVGTSAQLFRLVGEGACTTVGDKGVVPTSSEVLTAFVSVTGIKVTP